MSTTPNDELNSRRPLRALGLLTFIAVSCTLHDMYQFQKSFYGNTNAASGNQKGKGRETQATTKSDPASDFIPLPTLLRVGEKVECAEGLLPAPIVSNATADSPAACGYKIPRIFHQTGEGMCMTDVFYDNAKAWSFEGAGWSFYFHDRKAKMTLLEKFWPEFPQLQNAYQCLQNAGGAAVADLWRYLALWEYGGCYTDMDNEPGPLLNASTINSIFAADIDAFFLQDKAGSPNFPTQHFFGVSPKHPIMFFAVYQVLHAMINLDDVDKFFVPEITGPSALDRAFLEFMMVPKKDFAEKQQWLHHPHTKPNKGTYTGYQGRNVTIGANADDMYLYVSASSINGDRKRNGWKAMGYNDYRDIKRVPQNKTCLQVIMNYHLDRMVALPKN